MFSSTSPKEFYEGNGSQIEFDYSFDLYQNVASTLKVYYTNVDGTTVLLTINVDYTVNTTTKKVTLVEIIPAADEFIAIERLTVADQTWDATGKEYLDLETFEGIADKLTAITQENRVEADNVVKLAPGSSNQDIVIKGYSTVEEGNILIFDEDKNLVVSDIEGVDFNVNSMTIGESIIFPDGSLMSSANLGSASDISNPGDIIIQANANDVLPGAEIKFKNYNTEVFNIANDGNTTIKGIVTNTNTTQSSSTASGAIVTAGGVGVAKNLTVGGDANISGALTIGSLSIGAISASGIISSTNTTEASNYNAGAITTAGGLGVTKNIYAHGNIYSDGTIDGRLIGAMQRIYYNVVGTTTDSVNITSLQGDTDLYYDVYIKCINSNSSNRSYLKIAFNGVTNVNFLSETLRAYDTTPNATEATAAYIPTVNTDNAGGTSIAHLKIFAKTGTKRLVLTSYTGPAETGIETGLIGSEYQNTSTEITSIQITSSQTSGIGAGTTIEVFARR